RFVINTTFGFGGIADVASEMGLERHREDFGQTLGRWGLASGPYLVLPIFGPSSVRDGLGFALDMAADPVRQVETEGFSNNLRLTRAIDQRASLLTAGRVVEGAALDKYSFVRDGYLQRRRNQVWDGDPPPEPAETESK
ncbi:MAG TPA: VacJ family lipoprotein, partial [Quisquiliibacterium sp.]|nr:VacJ family lipoprotein [Quisquiliibacterium sp.]